MPLPSAEDFADLVRLDLDNVGRPIDSSSGQPVKPSQIPAFLDDALRVAADVTDIFIWVHGWLNDSAEAEAAARRIFSGISARQNSDPNRYPKLPNFKPYYIAVTWPADSSPLGFWKIRNRVQEITTAGYAEYFLAELLGYAAAPTRADDSRSVGPLQAAGGQYVHCLGHSFGGRFLAQTIMAAANPQGRTTRRRASGEAFAFHVDSFLVFQMAAPRVVFDRAFADLLDEAPLKGPVVLTYSKKDRANCVLHWLAERRRGIGCTGAAEPSSRISRLNLRPLSEDYEPADFEGRLVNVSATWLYDRSGFFDPIGAHSDFFYEESVHLILSLANLARGV